jgi:predicted RNase H-like nuclease (RuvC/YqgF family)
VRGRFCGSLTYQFVRVSWQFAGERQSLHETIKSLEKDLSSLRKTEHALHQKEAEATELEQTIVRLKFDLEEMRKRVNGSEKGTLRSNSLRSLGTIGMALRGMG